MKLFIHTFTPRHSHVTLDEETRLHKIDYFPTQCQSLSTMLNLHHLNYPSCKMPFLSSHTFHLFFPCMHCSSISSSSPATILSCSRSHRSLAPAQSLEQGAQLGRQGLRYVWQCFSRPLYTEWLYGARGAFAALFKRRYEGLLNYNEMSSIKMSQADNKMEMTDMVQTDRRTHKNTGVHDELGKLRLILSAYMEDNLY